MRPPALTPPRQVGHGAHSHAEALDDQRRPDDARRVQPHAVKGRDKDDAPADARRIGDQRAAHADQGQPPVDPEGQQPRPGQDQPDKAGDKHDSPDAVDPRARAGSAQAQTACSAIVV